ncbi:retrovirus-related pol polyprotein from transposon RE1 [Citrus sinensis]|uniref:Retrovirus-related pol polyprotein from transposon RE1 n=1 Tax=Citrus sinensis TaxID=2711 RepID=A0ACB8JK60_CITSI|nr:retrovirus-related pol polyprotein from transposon RE1 [Citrus sinensis]
MAGREKENRNMIDSSSLYYLHPFDHTGMIISPMKLNGENYEEWSRSMCNAFRARRKQSFLNGKIEKPAEDALEIEDGQIVAAYFGRLKILWDELSNYVQPLVCSCSNWTCNLSTQWEKQKEEECVHQFLMGLDDTIYGTVRSNIIAQDPLLSQSRAYALVVQEERHQTITRTRDVRVEAVSFAIQAPKAQQGAAASFSNNANGEKSVRKHCGKTGHEISSCFKIIGYLEWWTANHGKGNLGGRGQTNNSTGRSKSHAVVANAALMPASGGGNQASPTLSAQDRAALAATLTDDQWATMVNMLNSQNKDVSKEKLSGKWILDTGASRHMTGSRELMTDLQNIGPSPIGLPNGTCSHAQGEGTVEFGNNLRLNHVLYVPDLNCNLISLACLINDLQCLVTLTDKLCVIQDRTMRTLIDVGEQEDGVYIFRSPASVKACRVSAEGNYYLWHRRLVLNSLFAENGIEFQASCVDTPQQNGRVERKHRHLLNVGRALRFQANLPLNFWGECILSAAYIINHTPTPLLDGKNPYELLHGKPPPYAHFRSFGCLCYAHYIPRDKNKFNPRSRRCVFVGYPHGNKGWRVFDLETNEFFVSRDVVFFEDTFPYHDISLVSSPAHDPCVTHDSLRVQHVESPLSSLGSNRDVSSNDAQEELKSNDRGSPSSPHAVSDFSSDLAALHDRGSSSSDVSLYLPSFADKNIGISVRQSTRPKIPNTHLHDFMCHTARVIDPAFLSPTPPLSSGTPYPIAKFVTCANFSTNQSRFLEAITTLTEPTRYSEAVKDPRWREAMAKEIDALEKNETWTLADLPPGKKAIGCKWVYCIKYHSDGSIERCKARLVILAVAVARDWELHQMDVNNAFLHGDLAEEVYMQLPPGFSTTSSGKVCRLRKSLYGLRQAPRNWFAKLAGALKSFGFDQSYADYSLFTFARHDISIYVLVYVDDLIIAGNNTTAISAFKAYLSRCFHMKDLGVLMYFLGIEISRGPTGMFLSQCKHTLDILAKTGLLGAKPAPFLIDQNHRLALDDGPMYSDHVWYCRFISRLIYLTITRPELCYSVHVLVQFMQCPREIHWEAATRVLRYLKCHPGQGGPPISWKTKKQHTVFRSLAEVEYRSMAFTCCELTWLKALLKSLGVSHSLPMRLYCDSQATLHIATNSVFHERTKHIEIDSHYVQDQIHAGNIVAPHVRTSEQLADIFTKALGRHQFENILRKLGIRDLHAPT